LRSHAPRAPRGRWFIVITALAVCGGHPPDLGTSPFK